MNKTKVLWMDTQREYNIYDFLDELDEILLNLEKENNNDDEEEKEVI